jgi:hypothetical protein
MLSAKDLTSLNYTSSFRFPIKSFFSRLPVDSTSVGLGSFIAYLLILGLGLVMPLMTFETRFALLYSFISINSPL